MKITVMKGNHLKMYVHNPCKNIYPENDYFTFCFIFSIATYCTVLDLPRIRTTNNAFLEKVPHMLIRWISVEQYLPCFYFLF